MSDSEVPNKTAGDAAHAVARSLAGAIPFAGTAANELFSAVITPPLEKRRNEWMESVGKRLLELETAGFVSREQLSQDESFASTLLQASTIAVRHHESEKLSLLRNAVASAAINAEPEESRRQMFLRWVDELTVAPLRILALLSNPRQWFERNNRQLPQYVLTSSLSTLIGDAFPELRNRRDFVDLIHSELVTKGLLTDSGGLHTMMSAGGAFGPWETEMGRAFMAFVATDPTPHEG